MCTNREAFAQKCALLTSKKERRSLSDGRGFMSVAHKETKKRKLSGGGVAAKMSGPEDPPIFNSRATKRDLSLGVTWSPLFTSTQRVVMTRVLLGKESLGTRINQPIDSSTSSSSCLAF